MDDLSLPNLVLRGALHSAALGLLIGGLEALPLGALVTLPPSLIQISLLTVVAALAFSVLGFVVAFLIGWPIHFVLRNVVVSRGLSLQVALTTLLLVGYLFGGFAWDELNGGRAWAAAVLLAMPVFLGVTIFLLAGRLYRMAEFGQRPPVGIWPVAGLGALAMMGLGIGLSMSRDLGGQDGLDSDPRMVVVVVDGLRADLGSAETPNLDRLVSEGAVFTQAVSPTPDPAGAVASLMTGLPPTTHRILRDSDRMIRAKALMASTLADSEYATAGFVSSPDLGAWRGFDYGFHVYDDARASWLPGASRERVLGDVGRLLGLYEGRRPAERTVDAFLSWLDGRETPFFALVHLSEPLAPFEPHGLPGFEANGTPDAPILDHAARIEAGSLSFDATETRSLRRLYKEEVAVVDAQVGRILDGLTAKGLDDRAVVVVVGSVGHHLGEHGIWHADGLRDETIHVPLIIKIPGKGTGQVVSQQVRMEDLYPTLLEHAQVEPRHQAQGLSLLGFFDGSRKRGLMARMIGRDADGSWVAGARSGTGKVIRNLGTGDVEAFDLEGDPEEAHDVWAEAADALSAEADASERMARTLAVLLGVPLVVDEGE